jgi:hypothetical protein
MTETIDIATALDTPLTHPQLEAKYQKLRLFSAQKIKSLLGTIENQTRKLKDYKEAPSDSRTATIKALKSKLKDQEFIAEILKEEICSLKGINKTRINDEIIAATIGGPKRFRQQTREEIENKLVELEIQERQQKSRSTNIATRNDNITRGNTSSKRPTTTMNQSRDIKNISNDQDRTNLTLLKQQEDTLNDLIIEIGILRKREAEIKGENAVSNVLGMRYQTLQLAVQRLNTNLNDAMNRLSNVRNELTDIQRNRFPESVALQTELDHVRQECTVSLEQNNILMTKMKKMELQLDKSIDEKGINRGNNSIDISTKSNIELETMERQLKQQLEDSESRRNEMIRRIEQTDQLREQLRQKNEEWRSLKRDMREVGKVKLAKGKT